MQVLYFDPCREDTLEFERFFTEMVESKKIPDGANLICGYDKSVLSLVGSRGGVNIGFLDFFVADEYSDLSEEVARVIHSVYPEALLYGLVPMNNEDERVDSMRYENILAEERLYKNTPFLRDCQQFLLEGYARSRNLFPNEPRGVRKLAKILRLVR